MSWTPQILWFIIYNSRKWLECLISEFLSNSVFNSSHDFLPANCFEYVFCRCYQSDQFDSTCLVGYSPQRNKWKSNEINSGPSVTEWCNLGIQSSLTCSQTPCGWPREEKPVEKEGSKKRFFPSSQLQPVRATSKPCLQGCVAKTYWYSVDCKLKLAVGVTFTLQSECRVLEVLAFADYLQCCLARKGDRCSKCLVTLKGQNIVGKPKCICLL